MNLNVQNTQMQNHQQTAQKLLDHSNVLKQIFQDQWFYLWSLTPQNLFHIDAEHHQLFIADGLIQVKFHDDLNSTDPLLAMPFIQCHCSYPDINVQKIADFIFNDISFLMGDLKAQHPLFLQSKVQLFRQLLVEEAFQWIDGENRIEQYLYNLTEQQAEQLDQIMIEAGYYQQAHLTEFAASGISIPLFVELNFKHLSLVNSVLGDSFLNVQQAMTEYDQLCFSADQLIPPDVYRMIQTRFDDHFSLAQLLHHQEDFQLLLQHAKQQPHVLGFSRWIKRGFWQHSDIFAKKQFTQAGGAYWDERLSTQFPLFYFNRTVNWLFKQDTLVIDWVASQLDDINVRIAVTALSFTDTHHIHPQVILETLLYFKNITGRILIQECFQFSKKEHWFDFNHPNAQASVAYDKHPYALKNSQIQLHNHNQQVIQDTDQNLIQDQIQAPVEELKQFVSQEPLLKAQLDTHANNLANIPLNHQPNTVHTARSHRIEISDSILYVEEWLHLLALLAQDEPRIAKQVYQRLFRVMQAYMLFLQNIIQDLPESLIPYIRPELQQDPKFYQVLHQHQLNADEFRQHFKHPALQFNRSTSVFDSYVADYLVDYFYHYDTLAKNVTWTGLYQQAVRWHQQIDFQDTLSKLRQRIHKDSWRRVSPQKIMFTERWKFVELNSLEQIIHESVHYKHCLALSYTERIADGEYVAFHMTHLDNEQLQLTLGCYFKFEQLHFDQLRLPNNEIPNRAIQLDALEFIQKVNQHLIWDFKEPKLQ